MWGDSNTNLNRPNSDDLSRGSYPQVPHGAHGGLGDGDSLDGVLGDSIHVTHWVATVTQATSFLPRERAIMITQQMIMLTKL